jgi:hypothetical protein
MKRVILRADDICTTTEVSALRRVYGPCWERGIPVSLALIPASAYRFRAEGAVPLAPQPLDANVALCRRLSDLLREGVVEPLLHGWEHRYGELARGSVAELGARLDAGLALLRRALPAAAVRVLVPPHDYCSSAGVAAAVSRGLELCSTWAATRGGGRLAHWWGRVRRLLGRPCAPGGGGRWPTDVELLDFGGDGEGRDLRLTERLLRLAEHWDSPVVLPQHYWRLLEGNGTSQRRYERWLCWLEAMDSRDDVEFVRFCDV